MDVIISSFPPLGRVTKIENGDFEFTVLLGVDNDLADDPWEVAVWHSSTNRSWVETPLSLNPTGHPPVLFISPKSSYTQLCFSAHFTISSLMKFTLKYRNSHDQPWRWSQSVFGSTDGVVSINPTNEFATATASTNLSDIIHQLNPVLRVNTAASQTLNTQLWTLRASVGSCENDRPAYVDMDIGIPWGGALR